MKKYLLILSILVSGLYAWAHNDLINLQGRVLDETGAPLIGAHVVDTENRRNATITNEDGRFKIAARGSHSHVEISYLGYKTESFILKSSKKTHTISLSPDVTSLEQIVVTGTRTPKALKDVPVVTRLITASDIQHTDATNIQDLLTEVMPGLEFGYAMSQETSLNMSGFGGNAILFLVDGERMAGETMDNIDYNRLNMDNVGRIEIVKGASSALYGANAVAGVVNIITRENYEPWTANISSRYKASGDEWRHSANFSCNSKRWNSQSSVQYVTAETIRLTDAFDTQSNIQQVWGGNTLNVKERLTYRASDKLRFIARGSYFARQSNRSNYDDHYNDYSGGLKAVFDWGNGQNLEASYSYDQYDKARFVSNIRTNDHDYSNRQHVAHVLYNRAIDQHNLTLGADYTNDYLTTYQFADNTSENQSSVDAFAQFDYNPTKWLNIIASVRYDYFSASKSNATTGRLAAMIKNDFGSVRATYAGGFRAPSLKEMYMSFDMAGIQMIYGNPNLKPERSHNFNLVLEHNGKVSGLLAGNYSCTMMGYCNLYDRRITTTEFEGDAEREAGSIYSNEDGVTVAGIDLNAQYRAQMGLGISCSYNYLHTYGRSIESQFTQPRPHTATFNLSYDKQLCTAYGLNLSLSGRYLSSPDTNLASSGAYSFWKASLQQRLWNGISVNLTIDNLFNYKPSVYYWNSAATTGTTYSVGLSIALDKLCLR